MKALSKEEMIKYISDTVKDKDITVYSISKETNITQSAIAKIINQSTKNPHLINVQTLYNYLLEKYGNDMVKDEKMKIVAETEEKEISESDFEKILNLKIEKLIKKMTDEKFNEINETLLLLLRKSFDIEIDKADSPTKIIKKLD